MQPLPPSAGMPGNAQNSSGILVLGLFFDGGFFVLVFFDLVFADLLQLNRIDGNHLEVRAALRARDDRAFIDLILIDVEIRLAFRTVHHDFLHLQGTLLYLVSSRGKGQVAYQENSAVAESFSSGYPSRSLVAAGVVALALALSAPLCRAQEMALEPPRLAADRHTDPRIARAIQAVSADRIRQTIDKLVS